jgi:predicted PhzF superfamily epimerase YddE/YHI9
VIKFHSQSGPLAVSVEGDLLTLDFPSRKPQPSRLPQVILDAFPAAPAGALQSRDYLLVYDDEDAIRRMQPDQSILSKIDLGTGGVIVTAPGWEVDFVSRFFTPGASIFEDPVTGSAHCTLIPYWSERLGKQTLRAWQLSTRGGKLLCKNAGERVLISGQAVTYLEGTLTI